MRFAVFSLLAMTGCSGIGVLHRPPPPPPSQDEPALEHPPAAPPPPGYARAVLDANGDEAKVSRVMLVTDPELRRHGVLKHGSGDLVPLRAEDPLCVAPCAVYLPSGPHKLLFTSMRQPLRSSTVDVDLPSNDSTTYVRHAIGEEGHLNGKYINGGILAFLGFGLTLAGGVTTAVGALGEPTRQKDGTMSEPSDLLIPGLIILGAGAAALFGGGLIMSNNRPVEQPGSTTTWTKAPVTTVEPDTVP